MRLFPAITSLLTFLVALFLTSTISVAQTSDFEKAQSFVKEGAGVQSTEELEQPTDELLGRVVDIKIGGEPSTRPHVILDQLTFKIGEVIHTSDVNLTYKRLYQLGLFSHVRLRLEKISEMEEPPMPNPDLEPATEGVEDVIIHVEVWQGMSLYGYPYETGAIIGDRDIFLSGKTVEAAYFQSGDDFLYWHGRYMDPQFLGSHNSAEFLFGHLKDVYGTRGEDIYDFGERYLLNRETFRFMIDTLYKEDYKVNFGFEWQDNDTDFRSGSIFAGTDQFFLSEEEFSPGNALLCKFNISRVASKGYPWAHEGYTWSVGTDQAFSGLGSDDTFGRYTLKGTKYIPLEFVDATGVLHGEYAFTSGDPPHYQKPRLGYLMRGHAGLDYFGKSTIFLSGELRKEFWNDQVQGIAFIDLGKGYDSNTLSISDLDTSAGLGVRVDVSKFINIGGIILRVDYAWGESGDRWTFGIGQWYY